VKVAQVVAVFKRGEKYIDSASRQSFLTVTAALMPSSDDSMMAEPIAAGLGIVKSRAWSRLQAR
jgi:hypothetical protein